jgi:hypothetical protein
MGHFETGSKSSYYHRDSPGALTRHGLVTTSDTGRFSSLTAPGERVVDNMYSKARNMLPRSGGHVIRRLTWILWPGNGETLVPSCEIPTRPSSD